MIPEIPNGSLHKNYYLFHEQGVYYIVNISNIKISSLCNFTKRESTGWITIYKQC